MDERTVLRRAKEVLLERGWRNDGRYGAELGGPGPVCLLGAMGLALGQTECFFAGCMPGAYLDHLAALVPPPPDNDSSLQNRITEWNDEYASFEDVIALIDKALASLEPSKTPELVA